ncbi:MAG: hypothetical protein IJI05_05380, partial [Erysipelotrichaceae bacterium]|nr:hypothetical protein [Erysipelotrichaceae bacterium]
MKYINQNNYPKMRYGTNAKDPQSSSFINGTIESSGCGLCCLCMVVDQLTMESLDLPEAIELSVSNKANMNVGTNMKILGPVVAEKYGLQFRQTNSEQEMIAWILNGGVAIINVGGDYEGHIGAFCDVGHYILAIAYQNGMFRILDPAYRPCKYDIEGRKGKITDKKGILYTSEKVLHEDTENRRPRYYLFNN